MIIDFRWLEKQAVAWPDYWGWLSVTLSREMAEKWSS